MRLPRFLSKIIPGFEVLDFKEWISKGYFEVYIRPKFKTLTCSVCNQKMESSHGSYKVKVQSMPIFNFKVFLIFKRRRGKCNVCKKIRAEKLKFICDYTKDYA